MGPQPQMHMAGGATVTMAHAAASNNGKNGKNTIRHQHWIPRKGHWKDGSLSHDWVDVDWTVDHETCKRVGVEDPTSSNPSPTKTYTSVIDTGTQVTCIGKRHALELGIDLGKLSKIDVNIGSISGERLQPLGSCFVNISGS